MKKKAHMKLAKNRRQSSRHGMPKLLCRATKYKELESLELQPVILTATHLDHCRYTFSIPTFSIHLSINLLPTAKVGVAILSSLPGTRFLFLSSSLRFHRSAAGPASSFAAAATTFPSLRLSLVAAAAPSSPSPPFLFLSRRSYSSKKKKASKSKMPPKKAVVQEKVLLGRPGNNLKSGIVCEH